MTLIDNPSRSKIKKIHFIGIGGSGMSGIAEVLINLGYEISGSDIESSAVTEKLEKLGCNISYSQKAENVLGKEAVVVSSAINKNNPELREARHQKLLIVPRAEMLGELMRFRFGIAVSGTHGKTTTTSLIVQIMSEAKLDPTYIIGGIINATGMNAKLGKSDYLIAEADESDASFLHLQPMLSVITNIDEDHMATYNHNYAKLTDAFISFTSNLPFYGICVACIDDKGVKDILKKIHRPVLSYGFSDDADVKASNIDQNKMKMTFDVSCDKYQKHFPISLNLIGRHNISNALAAISVALELDIKIKDIQKALAHFSGVSRRLDYHQNLKINNKNIPLFDDYGHHPNEISEVFTSLRNTYPDKRLVVIFQPHRYSRTRDLFNDFVGCLSKVDALILLNIYSANELPINTISSSTLADSIRRRSSIDPIVAKDIDEIIEIIPNITFENDVVLTLGAGDVNKIPHQMKEHFC
ncbi:MAG: UDP-N-acetylmuramate--L-alanine ligase [Pseudomonadota bacterium]|nr:UDP-N-acetylmuramate--L-alanine ligase [Pseudomonadota bacterium]